MKKNMSGSKKIMILVGVFIIIFGLLLVGSTKKLIEIIGLHNNGNLGLYRIVDYRSGTTKTSMIDYFTIEINNEKKIECEGTSVYLFPKRERNSVNKFYVSQDQKKCLLSSVYVDQLAYYTSIILISLGLVFILGAIFIRNYRKVSN